MTEKTLKIDLLRGLPVVGEPLADRLEGAPTVGVLRLTGVIGPNGMGRRNCYRFPNLRPPLSGHLSSHDLKPLLLQ